MEITTKPMLEAIIDRDFMDLIDVTERLNGVDYGITHDPVEGIYKMSGMFFSEEGKSLDEVLRKVLLIVVKKTMKRNGFGAEAEKDTGVVTELITDKTVDLMSKKASEMSLDEVAESLDEVRYTINHLVGKPYRVCGYMKDDPNPDHGFNVYHDGYLEGALRLAVVEAGLTSDDR